MNVNVNVYPMSFAMNIFNIRPNERFIANDIIWMNVLTLISINFFIIFLSMSVNIKQRECENEKRNGQGIW